VQFTAKRPELHGYLTMRDRAANLRLFRLVSEVLHAIAAGAFHPVVGWHCQACPYRPRCWAWGGVGFNPLTLPRTIRDITRVGACLGGLR
jgi:hypothetical protein